MGKIGREKLLLTPADREDWRKKMVVVMERKADGKSNEVAGSVYNWSKNLTQR
eukprot:m.259196 g.259196  ORF g.259196 m.259196 type:complete len:53 (-) comp22239_c0_seq1:8-166(-)